jgi:Glycosyl transferases group 1
MIPEVVGDNFDKPEWREKHTSIRHASAYIAISENTAHDLVKYFPAISLDLLTVAHCGVANTFSPASLEEVNLFKTKYAISKPYFLLVGGMSSYKNIHLFLQAFAQLPTRENFEILVTDIRVLLNDEFRSYTSGSVVHALFLNDEELRLAYGGAIALVYPSKYEGFGLPVLEALACGCPVITSPNASIPEVAGKAALYVKDNDVNGLANALCEIQKPEIRQALIKAGIEQAKKFSWSKMADIVSSVLIDTTLLYLNLRDINLIVFPDWSVDQESLGLELAQVIKAIVTHPNYRQITLLIYTDNITEDDASLIVSSVAFHLLMEEELDIPEDAEISLVGNLASIQWKSLLARSQGRIVLENENKEAISSIAPLLQNYFILDLENQFRK